MSEKLERHCTLLVARDESKGAAPTVQEIEADLESPDVSVKVEALKTLITLIIAGDDVSRLLMTVIRFCLNTEDHSLQKVLQLYWETVDKYDDKGALKPEMILVCNALRNNLNHPNEYMRGCTLRFIGKLKEPELLEPLVPSIKENLAHRHPYVRKNAAMAIHVLHSALGEALIPDAAESMHEFLLEESDPVAVRNAFIMLIRAAPNLALSYLMEHLDSVHKFGTGMQQAVLELVKREVRADPSKKGAFIKIIFQLLNSSSAAVTYEAAGTLVVLSTAPTAVRAAASAYTQLLATQSDNNIKLILLDRLGDLRKLHPKVMQESLMDVLRSLQSPSLDIRAKALDIALKLVAPRTVDEVVSLLKGEVLRTQEEVAMEHAAEYRGMLIRAIHKVAAKFPDVSGRIVLLLLDFLASKGADEIMAYAREVAETYPSLRADVIDKLQAGVAQADQAPVLRTALWVLGEYSEGPRAAASAYAILDALGEEPLRMDADTVSRLSLTDGDRSPSVVGGKKKKEGGGDGGDGDGGGAGPAAGPGTEATAGGGAKATTTLADGSYMSQVALGGPGAGMAAAAAAAKDAAEGETPDQELVPLRRLLLHGNFFLGACVASVLTKLTLRVTTEAGPGDEAARDLTVRVSLALCDLAELGAPSEPRFGSDDGCAAHVRHCLQLLLADEPDPTTVRSWLTAPREAFRGALHVHGTAAARASAVEEDEGGQGMVGAEADALVSFRQLRSGVGLGAAEMTLDEAGDLSRATGLGEDDSAVKRVHPLTGSGDPVYAEATVTVHDYDMLLDVAATNASGDTLDNCTLELYTQGDLKLVERPAPFTLAPGATHRVSVSVKVSSTETGCIFGSISFDTATRATNRVLHLDAIPLDLMDYLRPADCDLPNFRKMWAAFEWENKLPVHTTIPTMREYLDHLCSTTRMKCLTPKASLEGDADFLAANLFAKTVFGENALLNVSLERHPSSRRVVGFVRIRSKTQGIALKLGDRISARQHRAPQAKATPPS